MSYEASNLVYKGSAATGSARFTLAILASFADADGSCFPGIKTIAEMSKMSPRQITRHIAELEKLGEIAREARTRPDGSATSNRYYLNLALLAARAPDKMSSPAKSTTPDKMSAAPDKMTGGHVARVVGGHVARVVGPTSSVSHLDPSGDPSVEPPSKASQMGVRVSPSASVSNPADPRFQAFASACGSNPKELPQTALEEWWQSFTAILASTPQATPEEFVSRAARYHKLFPKAAITGRALCKHWASCGAFGLERHKAEQPEPINWRDLVEALNPDADVLGKKWAELSEVDKRGILEVVKRDGDKRRSA